MIRELKASNLALIDDLTVEFDRGFTVFTGETGAGKSILMDALGLVAGERAFAEQIRTGADEAEVSGLFELDPAPPALRQLLLEHAVPFEDATLLIRRRIQRNGRNRVSINDTPVTAALLKQVGDLLVDLHGQHDHQSLLHPESARGIIDSLADVRPVLGTYTAAYAQMVAARNALEEHAQRAKQLAERRDILEFQLREIVSLELTAGEEASLEQELSLLSSSTERASCAAEIITLLRGPDNSLEQSALDVRKKLTTLARLDPQASRWQADVENAQHLFSDFCAYCESYLETVRERADPVMLERINERLARVQRLKKKYGCSFDQLIEKQTRIKADLEELENVDAGRAQLEQALAHATRACKSASQQLSAARQAAIAPFDKAVTRQMASLGFLSGGWRTRLTALDTPGPFGAEELEFMVRTNPGEAFLALSRTASGGEISRLMLAVKSVLAGRDSVPVLVFDEIDTGIGGTVAHEVGRCLKALSRSHQALCISHLHQIAALADHHYQVAKRVSGGRTVTRVRNLSSEQRVDEIARMLGGNTQAAVEHAKELLGIT